MYCFHPNLVDPKEIFALKYTMSLASKCTENSGRPDMGPPADMGSLAPHIRTCADCTYCHEQTFVVEVTPTLRRGISASEQKGKAERDIILRS